LANSGCDSTEIQQAPAYAPILLRNPDRKAEHDRPEEQSIPRPIPGENHRSRVLLGDSAESDNWAMPTVAAGQTRRAAKQHPTTANGIASISTLTSTLTSTAHFALWRTRQQSLVARKLGADTLGYELSSFQPFENRAC